MLPGYVKENRCFRKPCSGPASVATLATERTAAAHGSASSDDSSKWSDCSLDAECRRYFDAGLTRNEYVPDVHHAEGHIPPSAWEVHAREVVFPNFQTPWSDIAVHATWIDRFQGELAVENRTFSSFQGPPLAGIAGARELPAANAAYGFFQETSLKTPKRGKRPREEIPPSREQPAMKPSAITFVGDFAIAVAKHGAQPLRTNNPCIGT